MEFDLITLGAGSGGVAASRRAAAHGARVAIVERGRIGGTCVLRGCVPKKLMMYAGQYGPAIADAAYFGWQLGEASFDMAAWQQAKRAELDRLERIYVDMLDKAGVTLLRGEGVIEAPGIVRVGQDTHRYRKLLIATGGRPNALVIPGGEHAVDSDGVLDLDWLPRRVVLIGAGFIGVEFAGILQALGAEVTLVFRSDAPLRGFDDGLRNRLHQSMAARGIGMRRGTHPRAIRRAGDAFVVELDDDSALECDLVVNATGRHPNTGRIGLERLGIEIGERGEVPVDEFSATSVADVFAVGDVTDRVNLTPVAIAEGRAVADSEFGGARRPFHHDNIAKAVFSMPPIGSVGLTEHEAAQRARTRVYEAEFRPMRTAFAKGEQRAYMKLLVEDASDRVVGIHMFGDDAPEIVQSLAVALVAGASKADFDRTVAVHPTTAEEFVLMREPARTVG